MEKALGLSARSSILRQLALEIKAHLLEQFEYFGDLSLCSFGTFTLGTCYSYETKLDLSEMEV